MGYYTWYSIEVRGEKEMEFLTDFDGGRIEAEYGTLNEMFECIPGSAFDSMKWYERQEDMVRISNEYPNTLITIDGQGEDTEDNWKEYYRNGIVEHVYAQISYAPPSERLLTNQPMPGTDGNEDIADEDF